MKPKVFISYSWTSQEYQERVVQWAERLLADGVDVVFDKYELKEGHDKYAFMEKMVTDSNVTHVLVFCDRLYAEKADARKSGVGTESQIISREVYEKVEQSKFIPIITEVSESGSPHLPVFLKSRIYVDFSSEELVNRNWEQLIRHLFGKPLYKKPIIGSPPAYINEGDKIPSNPVIAKFLTLKQAILTAKPAISIYRTEFFDACINYADSLRVRERPAVESLGQKILEDCTQLTQIRNYIADWVLLEGKTGKPEEFGNELVSILERLRELKSRPKELNEWSDAWFDAHSVFVYETFLYVVAALLKVHADRALHDILFTRYLLPEQDQYNGKTFERFDTFYGHSEELQSVLAPEGKKLYSPAAEFVSRHANHSSINLEDIIEGELLILLIKLLVPDIRWFPQTLYYSKRGKTSPLFVRATQKKYFARIAAITGISDSEKLKQLAKDSYTRLKPENWTGFHFINFLDMMNLDKLDTLD